MNAIKISDALATTATVNGQRLPKLELRRLKLAGGEETRRFEAELWVDGERVAIVSNEGTGGCHRYSDYAAEERVNAALKGLPKADLGDGLLVDIDCDLLVDALINRMEFAKKLRRLCAKSTLFRLKSTPAGEYVQIRAPYDVRMKAHLVAKYGEQLDEIANERIAEGA